MVRQLCRSIKTNGGARRDKPQLGCSVGCSRLIGGLCGDIFNDGPVRVQIGQRIQDDLCPQLIFLNAVASFSRKLHPVTLHTLFRNGVKKPNEEFKVLSRSPGSSDVNLIEHL